MQEGTKQDYREWLKAELVRRQRMNPRYSLRSFAQNLNLSPAFLSKVLNRQKNLSIESALEISEKLDFSETEKQMFCHWVAKTSVGDAFAQIFPQRSQGATEAAVNLELESFQIISDWYHFAIRELVETKGFKEDPAWISARLGIAKEEATSALERLARLKLIEKKKGRWKKTDQLIATPSGTPSRALKNHHSQMIQKGREALESQSVLERDITGITISTHPEKMEIVRDEIKKFRRKMTELLDTKNPSEVYQLNIQLFRLTEPISRKDSHEKDL
ncbi:MAG TPA: DUF4423 domain-containing protein [Bdellovibrio sp.]|nr:DUF4423 domain-containing protein [Bdellovibrio sp.]